MSVTDVEHIVWGAIILNTMMQFLDIIVYKTIIHKEWKTKGNN